MLIFGRIAPIQVRGEDKPPYVERLQAHCVDIRGHRRQDASHFLRFCRPKTLSLLREFLKPAKDRDKSPNNPFPIFGKNNCPKPSPIIQHFRFPSYARKEAESESHFVADVKKLSKHSKLGKELEDMMRDRAVRRIDSTASQTRLMNRPYVLFEDAVRTTMAMDTCEE